MGTVTIFEIRFTEDEAYAIGSIPYDDDHTSSTIHTGLTAREAADLIQREGLSFAATGGDWAANPDGSYISNYATAERVEASGHLAGFHPRVHAAIMEAVG